MGLSIKGYVLEPPRLSTSNSPYTSGPNNIISDQAAFDAAFPPGSEPNPRADYFILAMPDGSTDEGRFLVDATFGWTKNEGTTLSAFSRFDFDGSSQSFKLLPGAPIIEVGMISPDVNVTRLKAVPPIGVLPEAPFRLSYGSAGSGTALNVVLVSEFDLVPGQPVLGEVELKRSNGELNWNISDISTLDGQNVRFQRQPFYRYGDSTGKIGAISDSVLLLNPLPGTGQYPMMRIGYGLWLTPQEVATDASLGADPPAGTFLWSAATGRLKFSSTDVANHPSSSIYYDGVLFERALQLPRQTIGTVDAPGMISGLPETGGDLIFHLPSIDYQFASFVRIEDTAEPFDYPGKFGQVQVKSDGSVYFSLYDQTRFSGKSVDAIFGDLPIERGVSFRFFRTLINPGATTETPGDVTLFYPTQSATLASPIISAPQVGLPSNPIDDPNFPLVVNVEQGTGTFTGTLQRLDAPSPPGGLGYFIDFDTKTLKYANRRNLLETTLPIPVGATPLPDPLILGSNYQFELEIAPNTGVYAPLTVGEDALLDPVVGVIIFTKTAGTLEAESSSGEFNGTTFRDPASSLTVEAGDLLVVPSGTAKGLYLLSVGSLATGVTADVSVPLTTNVSYTIRRNREVSADRYWEIVTLADPVTKVEKIQIIGVIQNETVLIPTASGTFTNDVTLQSAADFLATGVEVGDTVEILTGADAGSFRVITVVESNLIQVAVAFIDLATAQDFKVTRRLQLPSVDGPNTRFRYGQTEFSTSTVVVANEGLFTAPSLLPSKTVEVSQATGNLNFSAADIPVSPLKVYWVNRLTQNVDYRLQPRLAFVEFTERLLAGEEVLVTYIPLDASDTPLPIREERASFLIRKETTTPTPRTAVTSKLFFNPLQRTVATNPPAVVYRGGRPQNDTQIRINPAASSITFLPDQEFMSDVLPHGERVAPDERVYIDYNVYEAVGGEKNITLLNPMSVAEVTLTEDDNNVTVAGDQTTVLLPGYLLRIEQGFVCRIATSVYSAGENTTTITLSAGEAFPDNYNNPRLYVPSGPTTLTPNSFSPSYFKAETNPYRTTPRGMNRFRVFGDRTTVYRSGSVVLFGDSSTSYLDFYLVLGSVLTPDGWTEVVLTSNTKRQYTPRTTYLKYSLRPIIERGATSVTTTRTPVLTQSYGVYRKVEDQVGTLLASPEDYAIDPSGVIKYTTPLNTNEEIGIFYAGHVNTRAGVKLRSSYTHAIVPTEQNGLVNQVLTIDYTVFNPDAFYYRVETLTNFTAEVMSYLRQQALSGVPTSGPRRSNRAGSFLYEQGRDSVYFPEGHLANQDLVARLYLKYINDNVNHLEDVLRSFDGRIVGADQGRFKFDGQIDNPTRTSYSQVTNEIDDTFRISKFPVKWSFPPLGLTYVGTYRKLYQASNFSRLFPQRKSSVFGITINGKEPNGNAEDGESIIDFGVTNLTSLPPTIFRRWPRALVTESAGEYAFSLAVDNATGTEDYTRPSFAVGMKVIITDIDGTPLRTDASPLQVAAVTPTTLSFTTFVNVDVPRGATVFLCTTGAAKDTGYQKSYRTNTDLTIENSTGQGLFIDAYWPFDGTVDIIPLFLCVQEPEPGEFLQMNNVGVANTLIEPFRFPALDGIAASDTGDTGIPMQIKTFDCEEVYVSDGTLALTALAANTSSSTVISGAALDATKTILSYPMAWPGPAIQVYDLVRFTTGPNAPDGFRRISAVGMDFVVVDVPFSSATASDDVVITASPNVTSGAAATFDALGTTVTDANLAVASVGQTIIFTSGNNIGLRRQIIAKPMANEALLEYPVADFASAADYRVSNHLSTYSNLTSNQASVAGIVEFVLTNDHHITPAEVDSEVLAIERYLDGDPVAETIGILSDILSPATQTGTLLTTTLTSATTDFDLVGVKPSQYVYIRSGSNAGVYTIASVSGYTLEVDLPFPVAGVDSFRVVKAYSLSTEGLKALVSVLLAAETWGNDTLAWQTFLNTTVPAYSPPGFLDTSIYANALLTSDLVARQTAAAARQTALADTANGPIINVAVTLASRDLFYDKRYLWIDGRVNVQNGFLVMQARAVSIRQRNLLQQRNNLIKLLLAESV